MNNFLQSVASVLEVEAIAFDDEFRAVPDWFSLFSAGHLGWFRWMTYGVFAFGLADRAVRKNKLKDWLLLGACVAWASFYQPDLWLLFTIFTALYFVWCCVHERKLPWQGALVSLANYLGHPDYYLVEMLTPRTSAKPKPLPPMTAGTWLGILSLCGTLFVSAFALRESMRKSI